MSVASIAFDRQNRMVSVADLTRNRALQIWKTADFDALDVWWARVAPELISQVSAGQLTLATGSDPYNIRVSAAYKSTPLPSALIPEAFAGVDGNGREVGGVLFGAVTTTKETIATGLGRVESLQAGASYLAAVVKTLLADTARSADKVSGAGQGYTRWVRVVNGSACSRCAMLAGISSAEEAFKRHTSCQCGTVPIPTQGKPKLEGLHDSPEKYFDSLSKRDQDRVFTKSGAEAIRQGASVSKVVNARRGANGIGYSHRITTTSARLNRMTKTIVGYRRNSDPIRLYTTTEGTTARGAFGRVQQASGRIRLMPEEIFRIAGDDAALARAFLRDAGYLEYRPSSFGPGWVAEVDAQRRADRIAVNRATLRFGNFTLG